MRSFLHSAFAIAIAVLLAGCGTPPPNPLMGSGHTPDYAAGFNDGCSSGKNSQDPVVGFYTKDAKRFETDKQYAEGWNAGFSKCANQQMRENAEGGRR
ncbi:MAG TPA: hypothetical protein VMK32_11170 [Burkholderiaceae bacterium]|nr:hypothetical protein [Burkholderiaceae bacterium]